MWGYSGTQDGLYGVGVHPLNRAERVMRMVIGSDPETGWEMTPPHTIVEEDGKEISGHNPDQGSSRGSSGPLPAGGGGAGSGFQGVTGDFQLGRDS